MNNEKNGQKEMDKDVEENKEMYLALADSEEKSHNNETESEKIAREDDKLGPFTEAQTEGDKVCVKKVRSNLVQQMCFSKEDLNAMLELMNDGN